MDVNEYLNASYSSLNFAYCALMLWDTTANAIVNKSINKNQSSLLGYQQSMYFNTMVIELSKVLVEEDKDSHSFNKLYRILESNKLFSNTASSDAKSVIDTIRSDQIYKDHLSKLTKARNKYIAHSDIKLRRSESTYGISVDNIEFLITKAYRMYEQYFTIINPDSSITAPDKTGRLAESIVLERMINCELNN